MQRRESGEGGGERESGVRTVYVGFGRRAGGGGDEGDAEPSAAGGGNGDGTGEGEAIDRGRGSAGERSGAAGPGERGRQGEDLERIRADGNHGGLHAARVPVRVRGGRRRRRR